MVVALITTTVITPEAAPEYAENPVSLRSGFPTRTHSVSSGDLQGDNDGRKPDERAAFPGPYYLLFTTIVIHAFTSDKMGRETRRN